MRTHRILEIAALLLILAVAAYFRWTGLAWDQGYLFHPDERQIVLVVSKLELPQNFLQALTPASPLNPNFFAYGSLPIYLLRALMPFAPATSIVGPWEDDQLARLVLFGRAISGLFDLGTIVLTYLLGRRMYGAWAGLVAAACIAVTVLHIQLSHFYAVDTLLTFFTLATLYCALRIVQKTIRGETQNLAPQNPHPARLWIVLCGISFGLAMATKVTALPLVVPIGYSCYKLTGAPPWKFSRERVLEIWRAMRRPLLTIFGIALAVFVVTQPYALIDWYSFGRDVIRETFVARGWLDYPYTRQYAGTIPFVYQVTQGAIWAMGLPLGLFAWVGGTLFVWQWWKTREWRETFLISFALVYFITIGLQYTKYLRYLLPLLPVLYLMAAVAWWRVLAGRRVVYAALVALVLGFSLLYSFAFVQMYAREHPWLTASRWIYEHVPAAKTLTVEQWDDALPTMIRFANEERRGSDYTQIQLPMYDDDTDAKRASLAQALEKADIVTLASPRVYGSIGRMQARYPMTNRYYEKLFDGELGFEPVMTTRNDPGIGSVVIRDAPFAGLPFDMSKVNALLDDTGRFVWNWGFADESYAVYDHPQPIVLQKVKQLSAAEIEELLAE